MEGGGVMAHGRTYAIFSAQYSPHMDGIEAFTQSVSRALADLGNEVIVVTNDTEGLGAGITHEAGVEIMRLPCFPLISGRFPLAKHGSSYRALLKDLGGRHLDGVLVNARFYFHSLLGMKVARRHGLRPVVLDHGSAWLSFSNPVLDPIVRFYERSLTAIGKAKYDPAYYGISKKSSEWLKTFGIQSRGEITNSIDAAQFRALSSGRDFRAELGLGDAFLVAFVGRLIPEKGVSALIGASKSDELRKRGSSSCLLATAPSRRRSTPPKETGSDGSVGSPAPTSPPCCSRPTCSAFPRGRRGSPRRCSRPRPAGARPSSPMWAGRGSLFLVRSLI